MTTSHWGVPPVQLGDRRVLLPGRRRWLRALAWLALLGVGTAGAFGLPLQWAVDHLPAGNAPVQLAGLVPDEEILEFVCPENNLDAMHNGQPWKGRP